MNTNIAPTASEGALQKRVKQTAIRDCDLDLEIANDWFAVDQEQWLRLDAHEMRRDTPGQKGKRSTSCTEPRA